MQEYSILHDDDGDYVELITKVDGYYVVHTRWLIPGSQIED